MTLLPACAFYSQDSYNLVLSMGKSYATLDVMWERIPLFRSEGLSEQSQHSSISFCAIWHRAMEERTDYLSFFPLLSKHSEISSIFFLFLFVSPKVLGRIYTAVTFFSWSKFHFYSHCLTRVALARNAVQKQDSILFQLTLKHREGFTFTLMVQISVS